MTDSSAENSSESKTDSEMSELAIEKEDSDFQDIDDKNTGTPPLPRTYSSTHAQQTVFKGFDADVDLDTKQFGNNSQDLGGYNA